jgi:hypothetical protein
LERRGGRDQGTLDCWIEGVVDLCRIASEWGVRIGNTQVDAGTDLLRYKLLYSGRIGFPKVQRQSPL